MTKSSEWQLALILDLGGNGDEVSMSQALRWVVTEHLGLDPANWVMGVSDNTNSMSGTRNVSKKTGGAYFMVRRALDFAWLARFPCVLHVIHLAYTHARPILMGAPMPAKFDRETAHPWNYLHDVNKEFGLTGPDYREMKAALTSDMKKQGVRITKSFQPIATRWSYEQLALSWERSKKPLITSCIAWQKANRKPVQRWKRIDKYASDCKMTARLRVMEEFGDLVVLQMHGRCKVDKTPRIWKDDGKLHPTPPGFCAANLGQEYRRVKAQFARIKSNPRREFAVSLEQAALLLNDGEISAEESSAFLERLKHDLLEATVVFETWVRKWLDCLHDLPWLVCELAGQDGKEFALAFLLAYKTSLPLRPEHVSLVKQVFDQTPAESLARIYVKHLNTAIAKHAGTEIIYCYMCNLYMCIQTRSVNAAPLDIIPVTRWACWRSVTIRASL